MSKILAIDVDSTGLYVATATASRGHVVVQQVAGAPVEGSGLSIGTAVDLGKTLKALLKQAGISAAPAYVCLGRDKIILKDITHPNVSGPEEPALVRFQAVKDLADNVDDLVLDYYPGELTPEGQKKALAVFTKKDLLKASRTMCETAGLKLAGLTPRPFATTSAVQYALAAGAAEAPDDATEPIATLSITDNGGEFTVSKAGRMIFTRGVPKQVFDSETALISELRRNLMVSAGQLGGDTPRAIYVAEAGPPEGGWTNRLAGAVGVPVHRFDPLANVAAAAAMPESAKGRFVGAVGLLQLAAVGKTMPINFAQPRQPRAERVPGRSKKVVGVLAALAALLLIVAGCWYILDRADKRLADLKEQNKALDDRLIAGELDSNRLKAAEEYANHRLVILDELYEASFRAPNIEKMKVASIDYEAYKLPNEKERDRIRQEEKNKKPMVGGARTNVAAQAINQKPISKLTMTVNTDDATLVDKLVSSLVGERTNYADVQKKTLGGTSGTGNNKNGNAYTITANIKPRKPEDYRHRLSVLAPVPEQEPEKKKSEEDPDEMPFIPGAFGPGFNAFPAGEGN